MKKFGALIIVFCVVVSSMAATRKFVHPGLLHNAEDLARISALVSNDAMPSMGSFEILKKQAGASYDYSTKGPFEHLARDGKYGYTKAPSEADCNAAYYNSLMWTITKDVRHADKAIEVLRKYAASAKDISGHDAPLCAGLQGFMLINAAEIIRYTYSQEEYKNGWNSDDTRSTERMFKEVFLPILHQHIQKAPYSNGNWGASVNKMLMAIGIFCDDQKVYDEAVDYFYNNRDNGSLKNYIAASGQCQESGRDQAHCMLGLGVLAETAECAWKQGDDLYAALDNRLFKGYEYLSKVNLGYKDIPFETYKDASGLYCNWTNIGEAGLSKFRSVFEIAYNHYVYRKGLAMPYTEKVLQRIRPEWEGWTCDNPGFGTLLFYLGEPETKGAEGQIYELMDNRLANWTVEAPSLVPEGDGFVIKDNGITLRRERLAYDSGRYPIIEVTFTKAPRVLKEGWLRLSYSVNSAPEFWTYSSSDMTRIDENTYRVKVSNKLSNNGTHFSKQKQNVTMILDFGKIEGIGIKSIISLKD